MTPEEINRTTEFLVQHAATFSAQMDDLRLRQEAFALQHNGITGLSRP